MGSRFPNKILPYVIVAPSVVIVVIFLIVPSIESVYLSLFSVSPFGNKLIFKGFANFITLFRDMEYLNSLSRSLVFTSFIVFVGLAVSLGLAVLANLKLRGAGIYRTALIWPYALSPAVAGTIWALLCDPATGVAVYLVKLITGHTYNWMTSGNLALAIVTLAATWRMLGYNVIFFLAGLQSIPRELLEAAAIDGASPFRRFWKVTFPLLSPITFFLFVMNSLYGFFEVFGLIDVMTQGGPGKATNILVYKLYEDGFVNFRTGFASAQSIVLFVFVAILTIIQFRFAGRRVFYR
ncbi:MAG: sugar ABC transporter permease [Deltaproteobacteria bacterium]|nr:sugar ABC transporter permease [Deltaproteobacteria bacterium]MCD6139260.1 sugar ABC transporter permease [Deltaproteobacteria bacterium]OQX60939.1 MAG: glycerol-3-phosphate ABC transporter permease [Desulfococcus sp. 4484_241]RLB93892.1 MAG: sugar ABC transporter permease [Deltaproteobacteria bacterium]RLC09869.1 MAG: sugar ABC transporter permease [Deltaproteobacteria bacterium]